jgi:PHD/YefM family antitoxin component YafN of YafNO toxin-antitoxin module
MKTVAVSKVDSKLDALLGSAQKERVVLTRSGKPSAILIGIESYDAEDLQLASSSDFWRMIEGRRSGATIPLAELKARLIERSGRRSPKSTGKANHDADRAKRRTRKRTD